MKSARYLVTGGLGFLGAPLVRALLHEGHTVRVLDNLSRGSSSRLDDVASDIEIIEGDIRDADAVIGALRDIDVVCHLAYVNGTQYFYERPGEVLEVGVKGMVNVLDGCRKWRVGELILASSSEVYQTPPSVPTDESVPLSVPDPHNPRYSYGGGKIISELMALHCSKDILNRVVIFRPHNVFGPNMGWEHVIPQFVRRLVELRRTRDGGEALFAVQGTGNQSRAFIYIDDFTDGLMTVVRHGKHQNIYNIGTAEEIAIRDVAHDIAACLGMRITIEHGLEAAGGTLRRCPDIGKLRTLGFEPRMKFHDALPATVGWYAERAMAMAPAAGTRS